jgi:hypothetical protein
MVRLLICILAIALSGGVCFASENNCEIYRDKIREKGETDDGPGIQRLVKEAVEKARSSQCEKVTLRFPPGKVYYAKTIKGGYLFNLSKSYNNNITVDGITVDGGGSTFLLDPQIRFADLTFAKNVELKNFNVDYEESMFIECTIKYIGKTKSENGKIICDYIDVVPNDKSELNNLVGRQCDEKKQPFFGFVWCDKDNYRSARHFWVEQVETVENGTVKRYKWPTGPCWKKRGISPWSMSADDDDQPKEGDPFSAPRAKVGDVDFAHVVGPGALFKIHDVTTVRLENISVWGAPWFAFSIYRCEGRCEFFDVDVVPRPGTERLMSACRDAFHVTANRTYKDGDTMTFRCCDTRGTGDDDYNFCILSSEITEVINKRCFKIQQRFNDTQYNPMSVGDHVTVMNNDNSEITNRSSLPKIIKYEEPENGPFDPGGPAPIVKITLDKDIDGLEKGLTVWSEEAANPNTIMAACTANFSVRLQTSIKIYSSTFNCYVWAYGMDPNAKSPNVEGPGPFYIEIYDSFFGVGRSDTGFHAQCLGTGDWEHTQFDSLNIKGTIFNTKLKVDGVRYLNLTGNRFNNEVILTLCGDDHSGTNKNEWRIKKVLCPYGKCRCRERATYDKKKGHKQECH